jgi:hypothetical protein
VPLIENAQGVQQLAAEHRAAAAVVGQPIFVTETARG